MACVHCVLESKLNAVDFNVESVKSADEVWLKTDQGYRRVNNDLVSKLREAPDLKTQNELLKDTGIKLTESTNWKGKGIGKNKIKTIKYRKKICTLNNRVKILAKICAI